MYQKVIFPTSINKIIYADPSWKYGKYNNDVLPKARDGLYSKYRITPYAPMDLEDIKKLPVQSIAAKDSVLFLWVTMPCLEMGLEVIKAWGFTFKTNGFTWIKRNKNGPGYHVGLGNYTRANPELCLLATRGHGLPVISHSVYQIVDLPLSYHSKKPDEVRKRIVRLFGDVPRIELFSRSLIDGWETWGNDERLLNKPLEKFNV